MTETNLVRMEVRPDPAIDELAERLEAARAALKLEQQRILNLEAELLQILGNKLEGSETTVTQKYKVTTTGRVTRKLDADGVRELHETGEIPRAIYERLFSWEPKLNLREFRFIEHNEPDHYKTLSKFVTTKPAKASIALKRLK